MKENKTKKESKFKQIKRSIFINITRKQSNKEYKEMLKKIKETTGQEPEGELRTAIRRQIIEKNAKKAEGRAVITAATIFLSGAIGVRVGYALNEGSGRIEGITRTENGINIDTNEIDGKIVIDIPNQENVNFKESCKVTLDNEIIARHGITESKLIDLYQIKNNVRKEVESLETKDDILNYVKEEYVKEYNKTHDEKISVENVTFHISSDNDNIIYRDLATNGEQINRICTEDYAKEHELKKIAGNTGQIIIVRIDDKIDELAVGVLDHFERAYSEKKVVNEQSENSTLEKLGNLLNAGKEYAFAKDNKPYYKNTLISEMVKYREAEIEAIINGRMNDKKDSQGFEIGD